jgi:hypothetical protein
MTKYSMTRAVILAAGAGISIGGAAQAQFSLQPVIRTNDAVPGLSSGEVWLGGAGSFSLAGIDTAGNVAIFGTLQGTNASPGPGGVNSANARCYFYGAPGSLNLFARDGAAGPTLANPNNWTNDAAGGTAAGLSPTLVMSGNGTILASSVLNGTGAVSNSNNSAFWTGSYNSMQMVAQRGVTPAAMPGTSGAAFASNYSPALVNNSGQAIFSGSLTGGDTVSGTWSSGNLTNDSGIWIGNASSMSNVMREGDVAPGTGGAIFGDVSFPTTAINSSGSVAFKTGLRVGGPGTPPVVNNSNNNGLWSNAGGSLALVARASDSVPGAPGVSYGTSVSFASLSNQAFSNSGRIMYDAALGAGSTTADNEALMTWTPAGGASIVYRKGGAAPGTLGAGGATFSTFNGTNPQYRLNNNDMVAFCAQLQSGGVTTSNDETIWISSVGGTPTLVAREGDPVPGLSGVNFGSAIINASGLVLNNLNEVAFTNTLSDGTKGLFVWDPVGGLTMVVRTTQTGVVPGFGALTTIGFGNGGNGDGGSSNLSDTGWLTFTVGDGTNFAVMRTQVPAPAPLGALGMGWIWIARRRRR